MDRLPSEFISCDWGTSNFRLRRVRTESLEIVQELTTPDGVRRMGRTAPRDRKERFQHFADYLAEQLDSLSVEPGDENLLVVASGMASSSIGMRELPYADLPFSASGVEIQSRRFEIGTSIDLILISGVKSSDDVMRGEEVQAVGLAEQIDIERSGVLLLPGTHSKHIRFQQGAFTGFQTFMTGELFDVLQTQSVLSGSVHRAAWSTSAERAFVAGVERAVSDGLSATLFSVRAGQLLEQRSREENYHYLSGLLTGAELSYLRDGEEPVWLSARKSLCRLYRLALNSFLPKDRIHAMGEETLNKALLTGQRKILARQMSETGD